MKIEIVRIIPFSELEQKLRDVPLMKRAEDGSEIKIYKDADISLKRFHSDQVNPTSFYLLRENLEFQRDFNQYMFDKFYIDVLNLDCGFEIMNEEGKIWGLLPPIIEITPRRVRYIAKPGEISYNQDVEIQIPIINDGIHRIALAREKGAKFTSLLVSGAIKDYPFYAHPNSWDQVRVVDKLPATKEEKKLYSREDCYGLYRNFDILGCGKPRGTSK